MKEKNTCGIARFPCGSTAFLFHFVVNCSLTNALVVRKPREALVW